VPQPVCTGRGSTTHRVPYGAPPEPSHSVLYACAARPRPHRLEIRSPPPCAPALSEAPMALRAGGRREAKVEAPRARRAILKPNPFARPPPRGRARPTQAAAPRLAGGPPAATLAAQARPHRTIPQARVPPRLHRLSQLHAEGRCSTGVRGRSISLGAQSARVLTACRSGPASLEDRAWCSWSLRCCAGRTLQTGGQRSHRTTEDRGSQQSASMDARPTPLDRRRSARAAAERRSGLEQRGGQRAPRIALAAAELQDVVSFYLGFRGSTY